MRLPRLGIIASPDCDPHLIMAKLGNNRGKHLHLICNKYDPEYDIDFQLFDLLTKHDFKVGIGLKDVQQMLGFIRGHHLFVALHDGYCDRTRLAIAMAKGITPIRSGRFPEKAERWWRKPRKAGVRGYWVDHRIGLTISERC